MAVNLDEIKKNNMKRDLDRLKASNDRMKTILTSVQDGENG